MKQIMLCCGLLIWSQGSSVAQCQGNGPAFLMLIAAQDRADMDGLPYLSGSNVMLLSAENFL